MNVRETLFVFESFEFDLPRLPWRVRIWCDAKHDLTGARDRLRAVIDFTYRNNLHWKPRDLADHIASAFNSYVNAVEVTDYETGNAELTYNDWP